MIHKEANNPFKNFGKDLPASVVVFLVALPYCLGIAAGAGVDPISGLIAGVVGGIVVGMLSGSQLGVSGPAAGLTPLILIFLTGENAVPSFEFFLVVIILAGVLQLLFAAIKAGVVTDYFPNNVIKGMLAGIGVILLLKQIPHAMGHDNDPEGDMSYTFPTAEITGKDSPNTFTELWDSFVSPEWGAVFIFAVCLSIIIVWNTDSVQKFKFAKFIPAPLLVVFTGVILNQFLGNFEGLKLGGNHLINFDYGNGNKQIWDIFHFPDFRALYFKFEGFKSLKDQYQAILSMAITIAVVGSLETLLSIEAVDKIDPKKRLTPANRELFAQGVGNIISGLLGGLPITQVVVRSSANVTGGGATKMSTIAHGFLFLICILTLGPFLNLIPKACLAAILIMIAFRLSNPRLYKDLWHMGTRQFIPFIVTIVVIVFSGLLEGIVIGLIFAIYFVLRDNRNNEPFDVTVKRVEEEDYFYEVKIDFHEEVTYLSKHIIKQSLLEIPGNSRIQVDFSDAIYLSNEVTEVIEEYMESLPQDANIEVKVKGRELELREIDDQLLNQIV